MKEHSQIDDMRAAIRGEWERGRKHPRPSPVVQPHDEVSDRHEPVTGTEEVPRPEVRDRLQPVPETEEVSRSGIFSSLFKRR